MTATKPYLIDYGNVIQASCKYEWKISNFAVCCESVGEHIISPILLSGNNYECKWRLIVYPYGVTEEDENHLSVLLQSENVSNVRVSFEFLVNRGTLSTKTENLNKLFLPYQKWGADKFIPRDDLLEQLNNTDGDLTICCEMKFERPEQISSSYNEIFNDFESLLQDGTFSDVRLVADKTEFKVHKAILTTRSNVFFAMFNHGMKEKTDNLVEIEDIDSEVFRELLRYIYVGKVENLEIVVKELLVAADRYGLLELKRLCIKHLCNTLDINNAAKFLMFADLYGAKNLKIQAENFIVMHAGDIISTPGFKELEGAQPQVILELFRKQALLRYV